MNKVRIASLSLLMLLAACDAPKGPPPLAGAAIGGPFTLTDQAGRTVRDSDFAGKYRMVYFGYTSCPDVCPTDLQNLMRGFKAFEKQAPERAAKVQPLFITVDPARDTPAVVAQYVRAFHPRLIGLTGSEADIAAVAKKFAIYYRKEAGSAPDRYLVAHSQMPMLFDPAGKPLALFPVDDPATDANEADAEQVEAVLNDWVE